MVVSIVVGYCSLTRTGAGGGREIDEHENTDSKVVGAALSSDVSGALNEFEALNFYLAAASAVLGGVIGWIIPVFGLSRPIGMLMGAAAGLFLAALIGGLIVALGFESVLVRSGHTVATSEAPDRR